MPEHNGDKREMKVSVVIPTYQRPYLLSQTIDSFMTQHLPREEYEVIVISDGDESAQEVVKNFPSVQYVELTERSGQSAVLNKALSIAKGKYICIQHDDDRALHNKLLTLSTYLDNHPRCGIVCSLAMIIDEWGRISSRSTRHIENCRTRGLQGITIVNERFFSHIEGASTLYRKSMIEDVGGWDETLPHGEELYLHLECLKKGWEIKFLDKITSQHRIWMGNKSQDERGNMLPLTQTIGKQMRKMLRDDIWVHISSLAERRAGLQDTITALWEQCDNMQVFLAGYKRSKLPTFISQFAQNENVWMLFDTEQGDPGTAAKFLNIERHEGYIFLVDDDILYPSNYVDTMIRAIERHQRRAIVCCHGAILEKWPVDNYFTDRRCLHFNQEITADTRVHVPGNLSVAWHTDTLQAKFKDFAGHQHNGDDMMLAKVAWEAGVPVICIEHGADWLRANDKVKGLPNLYQEYHKGHDGINALINSVDWQSLEEVVA